MGEGCGECYGGGGFGIVLKDCVLVVWCVGGGGDGDGCGCGGGGSSGGLEFYNNLLLFLIVGFCVLMELDGRGLGCVFLNLIFFIFVVLLFVELLFVLCGSCVGIVCYFMFI